MVIIHVTQLSHKQGRYRVSQVELDEKPCHEAEKEEETGPIFAQDDRKSDAIRKKGVKLRYTEQESYVSVNIVPSERMVSSSSIDFLAVSSIGL